MRIVSWNINGLRSQKKNLHTFLNDLNADILCLQETKVTRDLLEEPLAFVDGYYSFFSFSRKRSGYSGVATFCKKNVTPTFAQEGLSGTLGFGSLNGNSGILECCDGSWDFKTLKELDSEGRCIITQHQFMDENGCNQLLSIINVYCPRADPDRPERGDYKLSFYKLLRHVSTKLKAAGSFVIILGDINTSHRRIDHCDPDEDEEFEKRLDRQFLDTFMRKPLQYDSDAGNGTHECASSDLSDSSQNKMKDSISKSDFTVVDLFRYFHPSRQGAFTCWNTRVNARATNYGTRIDYVLCDPQFLGYIAGSDIHQDVHGSDHCPVSVTLKNINFMASESIPEICTKFYPEFYGSQQKLFSYFTQEVDTAAKNETFDSDLCVVNSVKRKQCDEKSSSGGLKRKNVTRRQTKLSSFFLRSSNYEDISANRKSENVVRGNTEVPVVEEATDIWESNSSLSANSASCVSQNLSDCFTDSKIAACSGDIRISGSESNIKPVSNNGWNFLMKGPPPAPLCSGHNEPTVLRLVKKKGTNFNKQFYACARGVGKEGDHNGRCKFFKWFNR